MFRVVQILLMVACDVGPIESVRSESIHLFGKFETSVLSALKIPILALLSFISRVTSSFMSINNLPYRSLTSTLLGDVHIFATNLHIKSTYFYHCM
jgi:hypothetical protein